MSTQPNKSTNRSSEADPATGPGANGSGGPSPLAKAAAKPTDPAKDGPPAADLTRPEGITPISDATPPPPPGPGDSAWSPAASGGPAAGRPSAPGAPGPGAPKPPGPAMAAPIPVAGPAAGGPARPGGPGGKPGPGGKAKRAVARLGGKAGGKSPRRAQLQLSRLEPWSVMKFSFVMSLVAFIVLLVAVVVLYAILSGLGVFDAISETVNDLTREESESSSSLDAGSWFSFGRIFGYTVLVGALNVLLITALSTVGSVIYNLAADLVGGVEVTLKEAE